MRAWIYNFTTFVYDVRSREFDVKLARLYASSSRVEVLERSSRVRVLERSSTSTSAQVLECEGSDLRVKLEYECSSARVSHIETRE